MILCSIKTFLFLFYVISTCLAANEVGYKKINQDAWIWPGRERKGIHLTFSDTVDWSDLWGQMTVNGFYTIGSLCVKGAFIMYENPLFAVQRRNAFEIVSGMFNCIPISENTKSMQLLGSVGHVTGSSITFFEKQYFGSEAFATVLNVGSHFFQKMEYTRSAIMMGLAPWTIEMSSGEKFCIQPDFDPEEKRPICLIRDFAQLLDLAEDARTIIIKSTQGCVNVTDAKSIHRIQDCLYWGNNGKVVGPDNWPKEDDAALLARSDTPGVCADGENGEETKLIFDLYNTVINKNLDTTHLIGTPKNLGRNAWKLELLDYIFAITQNVLPDDIVSDNFLNKVREYFVRKLANVWSSNGDDSSNVTGSSLPVSERDYRSLLNLIQDCQSLTQEGSDDLGQLVANLRSKWESISTIEDFESHIDPEFVRNPKLDIITEMVWMVGHITGYLCHAEHAERSYYWAIYFKTFLNLYMVPVVPEWTKPSIGLNILFGGYNYEVEYNKIGMLLDLAQGQVNDMDSLDRPMGLEKIHNSIKGKLSPVVDEPPPTDSGSDFAKTPL